MKKIMNNPIIRNIMLLSGVIAVFFILGIIAIYGKAVVDAVNSLGMVVKVAIVIASFICAIVFGICEIRDKREIEQSYENELAELKKQQN